MSGEYSSGGYGIKYITPTLIVKHANIDDVKQMSSITELDLSFKHSDEHKIQKVEHLDRCKSLQRLNICSQTLRKMNGLQSLCNLVELDLSGNKIEKIECIKHLSMLQKLDVSFNAITNIPSTISYLSQLIQLNISRNKLQNIRDVLNLRPCSNLQKLDLNNNPIYNLNQYRPFIIYYLSQISMLDSKAISQNELIESRQRFERNEMEQLMNTIHQKDEEVTSLKQKINNLTQYKQESQQTIQELNEYIQQQKQNITELNTQLSTQQQLIRSKNDALTKTRHELSEIEEQYHDLQLSMQHTPQYIEEQKEESEVLQLTLSPPNNNTTTCALPSKLTEACAVYLDSIQSVNELMSRFNDLRQQYETGKQNMNMIYEQIVKSNRALTKLKERHNIRNSMENPFENEEYSRVLSQPPRFNLEWNLSPIMTQKQNAMHRREEQEEKEISISEDSIKAKIREAHDIEEDIARIERELERKQKERRRGKQSRKSSMSSNGNRGSMGTYASAQENSSELAKNDELVQQFATLVQSMDKIEFAFSVNQRLSHSQEFDELRIKLVKLYIKRYKNEQQNVKENVDRLENETNNIESQLSDYISNRNALLLDIHRILKQLDTDCMHTNEYQFIPKSYSDHLPESQVQQFTQIQQEVDALRQKLQKEKNVSDLLRNQLQQRQEISPMSGGLSGAKMVHNPRMVNDLIVRAETAEHRIQQLSFVNKKLKTQNESFMQSPMKQNKAKDTNAHQLQYTPNKKHRVEYNASTKADSTLHKQLTAANGKIKTLEKMLKQHESELVEALTHKLKESETECNRLKRETEEKLSFAKYLMTTKEQRLEAEKTINLTLQREIEEMKEQSGIFTTPNNQYRQQVDDETYASPLHQVQSYTEPLSMNQSMQRNKRLFESEPIQSHLTKNLLNDDHEPSEHDAVRLNIDDDDDELNHSVASAQQNIMSLSLRLSNLKNKVQTEEDTIKELESKKCDLTQECKQCLDKLNEIQDDIAECKDTKDTISSKLNEIELERKEHKEQKAKQNLISTEESQQIVEELKKQSQHYANQLQKMENNTTELLQQKEDAEKQLKDILQDIEDKQQEYNQITKRIQIKNFELSNLDESMWNKSDMNQDMHTMDGVQDEDEEEDDAKDGSFEQTPTKREDDTSDVENRIQMKREKLKEIEERSSIACDELESILQQLNSIKNELRNHENYHKIIRLDAVETEMEERIKELSRLKDEMHETRNMERRLNENIAETTQELKGIQYQIESKSKQLNNKLAEIESMDKSMNKKHMELLAINKNCDKKNKKLMKLNAKLSEAEQLLKDITIEQSNANSKLSSLRNELYSKESSLKSSMDLLQRSSTTHDAIKLFKVVEQIETEHKALSNIETNMQKANHELKSLQDTIEIHKKQLTELQHETEQARNNTELQNQRKDMKEDEMNELAAKINDLQRNKRNLNREVQNEEKRVQNAKADVDAQKNALRKLKKEHHELDKQLNDNRYKLMSAEHDLSETKDQLNTMKKEYDKMKAKMRSKSKTHSPKQAQLDVELYKIYKKEESDRDQKLEHYNKRLIEMDQTVNAKKMVLMKHQNEMDEIKHKMTDSNAAYRAIKDESCKIQREIQINKGKLSIYQKEIENQRQCLDTLYEKKRQKTVEMFKEKSAEIQDANDRLLELQKQMTAVRLELDSKKRILGDIHDEMEMNQSNLDQQTHEKSELQQELFNVKQNVAHANNELQNKTNQVQNVEKQLDEMTETMNKMKKDITKRSSELTSDRAIELEALQSQINKARQEIIELNKMNLEKQSKQSRMNQSIANKESELLSKEDQLKEIEQDIERNNSELGQMDAKIQLKQKELKRIKEMLSDYSKQRTNLIKENKEMMKLDAADIVQEINDKNRLLDDCNGRYNELMQQIKDKEDALMIIDETIKKRSEDHEKLEDEMRETSFISLRTKSENLAKTCAEIKTKDSELNRIKESLQMCDEKYQSLNKAIQQKQQENDSLEGKVHELKKDLSSKKREFEHITLQITKDKAQLNQMTNDLKQFTPKKQSLDTMNNEIKEKESNVEQLTIQYENADNELQMIRSNITNAKNQYETLCAEIENLSQLREKANDGMRSTQKELQSMNEELERVKLDLELQSDQLYTSKSDRLETVMNELNKKARELNDIKKKSRSMADLLLLKEKELKQTTNQIQQQKLSLSKITSEHNDTQRKLKSKRNELRVVTMEFERKNKERSSKDTGSRNDEKYLSELSSSIQSHKEKLHKLDDQILEKKKHLENVHLNTEQYSSDLHTLKQENHYYSEQKIAKMAQISDLTMKINTKKQELDKARLEIELKSKQIDDDVSIKMREIMNQIEMKQHELNTLNNDCHQKNIEIKSQKQNITHNETKLSSLQNQIKAIQQNKLDSNHKLQTIKQGLEQYNTRLVEKENKLKDLDQEMQLKLQQLHDVNNEFDEQTADLRQSRSSLQKLTVNLDSKNNELQSIVQRIHSAKHQLDDAQNTHFSTGASSACDTPQAANSINFADSMNLSMFSHISSPEQPRGANLQQEEKQVSLLSGPLDVSLEEINEEANKSSMLNMTTSSPQIVIRTVEKLRRTIDAMCYPRGGCIFSLASSINHYNTALDTLEEKRMKLVSILQTAPHTKRDNNAMNHSRFQLDSDDDHEDKHVHDDVDIKENISSEQQSQAVSDLGKIWEELQTVKKVIKKLHLEKQHLETTLVHALNIIQNKSKSSASSPMKNSAVFASTSTFASFSTMRSSVNVMRQKSEVEENVNNVLQSIESQGNKWNNSLNVMDKRLKKFELKVDRIKLANLDRNINQSEMEMKHVLTELEGSISNKRQELNHISEQLNSQRVLLKQLKQQSDAIADKVSDGEVYQLSSSPTMARQIANKMRLEKQLNDLKQELNHKKEELTLISQQLMEEANQLKQQQNMLFSSMDSQKSEQDTNKTQIVSKRIEEIQKLYKLREKNLKKRIDFYKRELQKRDKELNDIENILSNTKQFQSQKYKKMQKDLVHELRSLQVERSREMNRRDLKNQIKERDEQITFLINHFGKQPNDESVIVAPRYSTGGLSESMSSRTEMLSQIEANLSSALAPFQQNDKKDENEENVDANKKKHKSSAYHFVSSKSSSDDTRYKKSSSSYKKSSKYGSKSMLDNIFGSNPIEPQHQAQYQRDSTRKSKKKRKHKTVYKEAQPQTESDDDDDVNYNHDSSFISDHHEDRYKTLSRKYG